MYSDATKKKYKAKAFIKKGPATFNGYKLSTLKALTKEFLKDNPPTTKERKAARNRRKQQHKLEHINRLQKIPT